MDDLEEFHPDRMADRILGMGDILTLMEQAQEKLDAKVAEKSASRLVSGQFTFNDMLDQYEQIAKMGSMSGMLKMIPGLNKLAGKLDEDKAQADMKRSKAIIQSMTPYEREHPNILKASRKKRIAAGAGAKVADVNKLLTQLEQMQKLGGLLGGNMSGLGGLGGLGGMMGGSPFKGNGGMPGSSKHAGSKKQKTKKKKKK
jgi:signal recognition particle subunit SRP54